MSTYDGWSDLTRMAGEIKNPGRSLPRALVFGTLGIVIIYMLINLGYLRALGFDGLAAAGSGAEMPATQLASASLGGVGAWSSPR